MDTKDVAFTPWWMNKGVVLRDRVAPGTRSTTVDFILGVINDMDPDGWKEMCFAPMRSDTPLLDIGAHVGLVAVTAAKCGRRVVAIEPDPDNAELLRYNAEANGVSSLVTVVEAALWSTGGQKLTFSRSARNTGAGSVVLDPQEGHTVEVRTLSLCEALDLTESPVADVKVDVEGAEFRSLYAARPSTLARIQNMFIEYHPVNLDDGTGQAAMLALDGWLRKHVTHVHAPPMYKHIDYFPGKKA